DVAHRRRIAVLRGVALDELEDLLLALRQVHGGLLRDDPVLTSEHVFGKVARPAVGGKLGYTRGPRPPRRPLRRWRKWETRKVEGLVGCMARGGSSPLRRMTKAPHPRGFRVRGAKL